VHGIELLISLTNFIFTKIYTHKILVNPLHVSARHRCHPESVLSVANVAPSKWSVAQEVGKDTAITFYMHWNYQLKHEIVHSRNVKNTRHDVPSSTDTDCKWGPYTIHQLTVITHKPLRNPNMGWVLVRLYMCPPVFRRILPHVLLYYYIYNAVQNIQPLVVQKESRNSSVKFSDGQECSSR